MRFGLVTPVVVCHPSNDAPWTEDAGPVEIARIGVAADRLGFDHLTCSEHVAIPESVVPIRGGRYYDPLPTFGFLAAQTTRIRFVTHVLVLGYHHPMALAKRYGTLDRIANGRLVLGVGVGTLREEFALLDVPFDDRGPRFDDALKALRAAFGRRVPHYQGTHYAFEGFVVDPCGVQERVPLWLGGKTRRSLRRALELGDGWDPYGLALPALRELLDWARSGPYWERRAPGFEVVLPILTLLDPTVAAERDELTALIAGYRDAGATSMNLRFRHRSLEHFLEQLEAFAQHVRPALAT